LGDAFAVSKEFLVELEELGNMKNSGLEDEHLRQSSMVFRAKTKMIVLAEMLKKGQQKIAHGYFYKNVLSNSGQSDFINEFFK